MKCKLIEISLNDADHLEYYHIISIELKHAHRQQHQQQNDKYLKQNRKHIEHEKKIFIEFHV